MDRLRLRMGLAMLLLLVSLSAVAQQEISVAGFRPLDSSTDALTYARKDANGDRAALIKVVTPEDGFKFDGGAVGIVGSVERRDGEYWLYVPQASQRLTISHPRFKVMRDYEYPVYIESGRVYEMLLDVGVGRYVTINASIANSRIYIDDAYAGVAPIHNKYLLYGRHQLRAVNDRYEGLLDVDIQTEARQKASLYVVEMEDASRHYGEVSITVAGDADIWFDGEKKATGRWNTMLREGSYVVETRKVDCEPEKTTFTVKPQQRNAVEAKAPVQHTGWLSVYTRPNGVQALTRGNRSLDFTGPVLLPVGTYQVDFQKKGYVSQSHEYTVAWNQVAADTVVLERTQYVKPLAFYFGAGYAVRSLSGVTGILGAVIQGHDIQASYTFGMTKSDDLAWYDANQTMVGLCNYKQSSLSLKYGYQFNLMRQLAITPQVGYSLDRLSAASASSSYQTVYGDGATAHCLTLGVKLLLVPFQHCYIFAAPEFDVALQKDDTFKNISDNINVSAGGFVANVGLLVNF